MKVKNPSTGNFEEVYVKALDSLPVGTEVDFTGSASDIPAGWEQSGNLIVTDNVTISSISINSGATVYKTFTIPSKTGYTPIAITPNSTSGGGSSYMVFAPTLEGYMGIYNGWNSNISNASISLKIIYLKN